MRGGDIVVVEGASDFSQAVPARVLETDPLDDASRERRRTSCAAARTRLAWPLQVLPEEALELGARDQPLTQGVFTVLSKGTTRRDWHAETATAVRRGTMRARTQTTLRSAATTWLAGAQDGTIRSRSGEPFKPSTLALYARVLRQHVLPELGGARISEVRAPDMQDVVDRLVAPVWTRRLSGTQSTHCAERSREAR